MKADTFIKLLRKVIREEVQSVVREELGLLLETPDSKQNMMEVKKPSIKNSIVESIKPVVSTQNKQQMSFTQNDILNQMLNETAQVGDWRTLVDMKSDDVMGFGAMEPTVVNNVDQMLANTRPAGDINTVQINAVPDFSGLMKTMKEKGQI